MEKKITYRLSEKEKEALSIVNNMFDEICEERYSCTGCPFYRNKTCGANTVTNAFRKQLEEED